MVRGGLETGARNDSGGEDKDQEKQWKLNYKHVPGTKLQYN